MGEVKGGKGSRFFFTVPLKPATKEIIPADTQSTQSVVRLAEGYHVKALVVDDVSENLEILRNFLADIGVEVRMAENGQQAIEKVRQSLPDIVFMDIRMPIMDGLEAAQQIWEEFGREALKIVAVSASTLVHEQEKYLSFGFDDFLPKPFQVERIYECLARLLQIEYDYADEEAIHTRELELSEITLPHELLMHLREAAEIYSFTKLNRRLDEVAQLGKDEHQLAEHLRRFVNNYDMDTILNILFVLDSKRK